MPPETDDSTNPSPDTDTNPKPEDQFGNVANAAARSHITRFAEKVLPGIIAQAIKPFQDEIAALKAPKPDDNDDTPKTKGKGDPQLAAMTAALDDMKNKFSAEQQLRVAAEKKARDENAHGALRNELAAHVNPALLGMLTDNLYHMKKVVEFDDDGTPLFKTKKLDAFGDVEEVRMPLKDGVAQYLKTEEAKAFLPAPSAGSGATQIRKSGNGKVETPINLDTASETEKLRLSMEQLAKAHARGMT